MSVKEYEEARKKIRLIEDENHKATIESNQLKQEIEKIEKVLFDDYGIAKTEIEKYKTMSDEKLTEILKEVDEVYAKVNH